LDGVNERVDVNVPLNSVSINGGVEVQVVSDSTYDIDSNHPNVCYMTFIVSDGLNGICTITLPAIAHCGSASSGYAKRFCFIQDERDGYDLRIDPNGTDNLIIAGTTYTAGYYTYTADSGTEDQQRICLIGFDGTDPDRWMDESRSGTWSSQ